MTRVMKIAGMHCGHCTAAVEKALRQIPGVTEVTVDLAGKTATVAAAETVSNDSLTAAVGDTGFEVVGIE